MPKLKHTKDDLIDTIHTEGNHTKLIGSIRNQQPCPKQCEFWDRYQFSTNQDIDWAFQAYIRASHFITAPYGRCDECFLSSGKLESQRCYSRQSEVMFLWLISFYDQDGQIITEI